MSELTFDHYTIKVKSLNLSTQFYGQIMGLPEIENRTQKEYIRWFSLGNGSELHVVEGPVDTISTTIGIHLALRLVDFDAFLTRLKSNDIQIHNSKGKPQSYTTRADGVRQVYFQDPDGYWIEVNEAGLQSS